jgi:hypothetical protein
MKALNQMNNHEKGDLLCRLFPEEMKNMLAAIKSQCAYFLNHEVKFRKAWNTNEFLTADFWYRTLQSIQEIITKNTDPTMLITRWFLDHFFSGYHAIFTQHCLIGIPESDACSTEFKYAIYMLFGKHQHITVNHTKH